MKYRTVVIDHLNCLFSNKMYIPDCCVSFAFRCIFCIFNRIDNPPTSAFRYKITEGSRYFVLCIEMHSFLVFTLIMLA